MNKKHFDKWGDPRPELRQALANEIEKIIPVERFKPKLKTLYHGGTFRCWADDVIKTIPENVTLTVDDAGTLSFSKEEVKRDDFAALTSDALAEYTKDQGPANLQELLKRGINESTYKNFLE